jgi:hypothetical protein
MLGDVLKRGFKIAALKNAEMAEIFFDTEFLRVLFAEAKEFTACGRSTQSCG